MENVQNNLEKSILATIAYFDVFNYPLTVAEIWKWLYSKEESRDGSPTIGEVWKILENNQSLKSLVNSRRGFYFLKNREGLVEIREARYVLAVKKIKRARRVVKFLKFIPGIKMIALCNSLAWTNAREESDIDFFIVTGKNKIWTARFWAAGFLQIFGLRPSKKNTRDKICLSFFADYDSLNLESLATGSPDIYLIYWVAQLQPLFDRGGMYNKFWQANAWINKFLPNVFPRDEINEVSENWPVRIGLGEKFFRWLQLKLMPKNLKDMANRDSRVVVSDHMLKFHANDRREEYKKMWEEKIVNLINS
jgi:predicted nucleotidyltransferase